MTFRRLLAVILAAGTVLVSAPEANAQTSTAPSTSIDTTPSDPNAAPRPADEQVHSFTLTPAGANNEPGTSNRPDLSYTADPGSTIQDAVTVFNLGTEQLTFRVYATDGRNADDGSFALLGGDETPTDVGSWFTFAQDNVTVAPGMATTIPVTITIPASADPGDHIGAVLASSKALSTDGKGAAVVLDRRTGTRIYLRVNGAIRPELAVEKLNVEYHSKANPLDGSATVSYQIKNRGNVRLRGSSVLSMSGPFGLGGTSAPQREVPELLPGQGMTVTEEISGVPALVLNSAKVKITPIGGDGVQPQKVSKAARVFALPFTLLLVAALALFGVLGRRAYLRHRNPPLPAAGFRA